MRLFAIFTVCLFAAITAVSTPPASARNFTNVKIATKPLLDKLFASLKAATNSAEAEAITNQIWQVWFLHPNSAVQHLMTRAQAARRAGLLKEAMHELNKVVELAPDFAEGWNQRATVLFMLGRDAESVHDIQQVLRIEPRHFGALSGLGLIHMRAQNWKSALASFQRALAIHPYLGERAFIPALKKKLEGTKL